MVRTEIVNVVATASLGSPINLHLLRKFQEIGYNPDAYGGRVAYFKKEKMQGRVSIFNSGKMISVGTKTEAQAASELLVAKQFFVEKHMITDIELQPKIQNVVVTVDFGQSINLEELSEKTRAIYEPEQFPGAILRIKQPSKVSALIFASGKIVLTGLTSSDQIEGAIKNVEELLSS